MAQTVAVLLKKPANKSQFRSMGQLILDSETKDVPGKFIKANKVSN